MFFALHPWALIARQTPKSLPGQANSQAEVASVRQFVQSFYDWYAPRGYRSGDDLPVPDLGSKAAFFSDELQKYMREDREGQKKVKGMKVGLYLDPFLSWIEAPKHYAVDQIDRKGESWLVHVHGVEPAGSPRPRLTVRVEKTNGGWRFANFIYDEEFGSFLDNLRNLKNSLDHILAFTGRPLQPASHVERASVRRFVQSFYNWYADEVNRSENHDSDVEADVEAVTAKSALFTPKLCRALLVDRKAQEEDPNGYIVGIDMDPFLNSQDPNRHYKVVRVEHKGGVWLVTVRGVPTQEESVSQAIAVVEKTRSGYGWRFTDFFYDEGFGLLEDLQELKEDRERHPSVAPGNKPTKATGKRVALRSVAVTRMSGSESSRCQSGPT